MLSSSGWSNVSTPLGLGDPEERAWLLAGERQSWNRSPKEVRGERLGSELWERRYRPVASEEGRKDGQKEVCVGRTGVPQEVASV